MAHVPVKGMGELGRSFCSALVIPLKHTANASGPAIASFEVDRQDTFGARVVLLGQLQWHPALPIVKISDPGNKICLHQPDQASSLKLFADISRWQ